MSEEWGPWVEHDGKCIAALPGMAKAIATQWGRYEDLLMVAAQ